jgi:hypothetical protein
MQSDNVTLLDGQTTFAMLSQHEINLPKCLAGLKTQIKKTKLMLALYKGPSPVLVSLQFLICQVPKLSGCLREVDLTVVYTMLSQPFTTLVTRKTLLHFLL